MFIKNSSICYAYKHQCFSDLMEMQHIMYIVLRGKGEGNIPQLQIFETWPEFLTDGVVYVNE